MATVLKVAMLDYVPAGGMVSWWPQSGEWHMSVTPGC